jgi:nitrate/nitrite-specific signal transduction histidine kinase
MENKDKKSEDLKSTIDYLNEQVAELTKDISLKQKALQDINKPTITQDQISIIHEAVNNCTDSLEISTDDFDIELSMNYDNHVEISSIHPNCHFRSDLNDDIIRWIENKFKVIEKEKVND